VNNLLLPIRKSKEILMTGMKKKEKVSRYLLLVPDGRSSSLGRRFYVTLKAFINNLCLEVTALFFPFAGWLALAVENRLLNDKPKNIKAFSTENHPSKISFNRKIGNGQASTIKNMFSVLLFC
jgi:hypothetical protein